MKDFDGELVGANLPYELDWSWEEGIIMPKVKAFLDVQVADPLLFELHDSYSLEAIGKRRNVGGKDEMLLREAARQYGLDPKGDMWMMPARSRARMRKSTRCVLCRLCGSRNRKSKSRALRNAGAWSAACCRCWCA
jgi:hypothetical protein